MLGLSFGKQFLADIRCGKREAGGFRARKKAGIAGLGR